MSFQVCERPYQSGVCEGLPEIPMHILKGCSTSTIMGLPVSISCGSFLSENDAQGYQVLGRIPIEGGACVQLISYHEQDMNRLLLITSDNTGKPLNANCLYQGECKQETRQETSSEITISEEGLITISQTDEFYAYMKHGFEYVRSLDSSAVSVTEIRINESGGIEINSISDPL